MKKLLNKDYLSLNILIGVVLFLILLVVTILRKSHPFWDEAYYLENVFLIQKYGVTEDFLLNYKGPAGPTFAIIHYLANPLTQLNAPWVRLVNTLLFGGTLMLIYSCFKCIGHTRLKSVALTSSAMAVPTLYTISGMALTEIPAIFFLTVSLYIILIHYKKKSYNFFLAIIAGLSLSFAILGRQPLMLIVLAFPILFLDLENKFKFCFQNTNFLKFIILTILTAIVLPIIVFYNWGNIQPGSSDFTGVGLAPNHFILAFGYSFIFTVLQNPYFFNWKEFLINKYETSLVVLFAILINIFILKIEFTPFKTIVSSFFSSSMLISYNIISGSLLCVFGLLFLYFLIKKQYLKNDVLILFFTVSFILIVATSIKVTHQFSARYVVQAFPLLVLSTNIGRSKFGKSSILFLFVGGILGIITLNYYFNN